MSLKILVFPIIIILSLTLAIGYIKPDVQSIVAKRTELEGKRADLARIDTVIQIIRKLHAEIDQRRESETFIARYLPRELEEERVLDTFNFLANQSGVIVTDVDMTENQPVELTTAATDYASSSFQSLQALPPTAEGAPAPATVPLKKIESYRARVQVLGSYQGIKDFFARLSRTDRFHETLTYGIEERDPEKLSEEEKAAIPADFLAGGFEADFLFYAPMRVRSALDQPLFQEDHFDFSAIDDLLALVNNPLPPLEVGEVGRPNPFQ